jgi:GTP-binding protein Era
MRSRLPPPTPASCCNVTPMTDAFRSGFVAIIGRPNVGKSTLLNRLVGQKVSITSHRPQTTRHRILGIRTTGDAQLVYVDTPGVHGAEPGRQLNRMMNREAGTSLEGVDAVVLVITAEGWTENDEPALGLARRAQCPVVLVINKVDKLAGRERLLPLIEESQKRLAFVDTVPLSARSGDNVSTLERVIVRLLPEHPPYFESEQVTDRSERFLAAELVREQIFRGLGQEIPYAVAVEITEFREEPKHLHIDAVIWVEKEGQKAILIGKDGERLKSIGRQARLGMQKVFGRKVWLGLWVKVREGWSDDVRALKSLGYGEDG